MRHVPRRGNRQVVSDTPTTAIPRRLVPWLIVGGIVCFTSLAVAVAAIMLTFAHRDEPPATRGEPGRFQIRTSDGQTHPADWNPMLDAGEKWKKNLENGTAGPLVPDEDPVEKAVREKAERDKTTARQR